MHEGDIVTIPAALTAAVQGPPNGRIALVLGAGCSIDPPTGLETASAYAQRACRSLVAANVIKAGDCDPKDLGSLADAVFLAEGSQQKLVDILRPSFTNASPNDGHKIAAALLAEQIVSLVLTLNFDRSLDAAVATIASGSSITISHSIGDHAAHGRFAVIYLHGDVESEADDWILRAGQIEQSWDDTWQKFVMAELAMIPNIVFAGLGSPTPVITETIEKVRAAIPDGMNLFQVDTTKQADNKFAQDLGVNAEHFVNSGWNVFMCALGEKAAQTFINTILDRVASYCSENHVDPENTTVVAAALPDEILRLGNIRAKWFFDKADYRPFRTTDRDLMVDVVRTLATAARITGADECVLVEDGMDFRKEGKTIARVFSRSGAGSMYWARAEGEIRDRVKAFRKGDRTTPIIFLATAVVDIDQETSVPETIVPGPERGKIMASPLDYAYFSPHTLATNPTALLDMLSA